jgi:hypothetical protein
MRLPIFTALALGAATAAVAAPAHYSLTLAGFQIGTLVVDEAIAGPNYDSTARFKTTGLAGILDYSFEGEALGLVAGLALTPVRFTATSQSPRALRHTRIDWEDGAPALVAVDPPRDDAVDPATAAGSLDPVSALIRLLRNTPATGACGAAFEAFDGSRSVRLTLGKPRTADGAITCDGDYLRLGGEPLTPIDPPECPFQLVYREGLDGRAILETIRIPTRFGQAVIAPTA